MRRIPAIIATAASATMALAVPVPDVVVYGVACLNGQYVTSTSGSIQGIVGGQVFVATFRTEGGSDYYVLRIPAYNSMGANPPGGAIRIDDPSEANRTLIITINDIFVDQDPVVLDRGGMLRLDLCAGDTLCGDGICCPCEGPCDCPFDCGDPPSAEVPGTTCTDGLDNDCDGSADCDDDDDCANEPVCLPEEACCLPDGSCEMISHAGCVARGGDPQGPGTDCDTTQCMVLKWAQPPGLDVSSSEPTCFWGWGEPTIYDGQRIVADDWCCLDERPVTGIHWWGSYWEWDGAEPPGSAPTHFHVGIWTDVPADDPDNVWDWSHPGTMIWESVVERAALNERAVGCDYYPFFTVDTCYRYDFAIPGETWFYGGLGGAVYWISIAAVYPGGSGPYEWGWKTREPFYNDAAIWIEDPASPAPLAGFLVGQPVEHPPDVYWDMAFVLTTQEPPPGDLDGDGDVDLSDLAQLLASYGECVGDPGYDSAADLDDSGCVDLSDLAELLANYGYGT